MRVAEIQDKFSHAFFNAVLPRQIDGTLRCQQIIGSITLAELSKKRTLSYIINFVVPEYNLFPFILSHIQIERSDLLCGSTSPTRGLNSDT